VTYEVEQKFPVGDIVAFQARLAALGAAVSEPESEIDHYYAHPARDFAASDEALRVRRTDGDSYLTYKGPKVDTTTKTRREIDLALWPQEAKVQALEDLLEALGFTPVAEVCKYRRKATVSWQGRQVEAALDEVVELGTFVELELVADEDAVEPARACIASLARELGLSSSERRSYLELLLEHRQGQDG
jgi:adenylate cyclase class 2